MVQRCWILTPLNEDLGIEMWGFGGKEMVEEDAIGRLSMVFFLGYSLCEALLQLPMK
jgi:hypothetical protein